MQTKPRQSFTQMSQRPKGRCRKIVQNGSVGNVHGNQKRPGTGRGLQTNVSGSAGTQEIIRGPIEDRSVRRSGSGRCTKEEGMKVRDRSSERWFRERADKPTKKNSNGKCFQGNPETGSKAGSFRRLCPGKVNYVLAVGFHFQCSKSIRRGVQDVATSKGSKVLPELGNLQVQDGFSNPPRLCNSS